MLGVFLFLELYSKFSDAWSMGGKMKTMEGFLEFEISFCCM